MPKPDKLPTIDPNQPRVFDRIIETAAELRRAQSSSVQAIEDRRRAERRASLRLLQRIEAAARTAPADPEP